MSVPISTTHYADCSEDTCEFYGDDRGHKHVDALNVTVMPPFDPGPDFWAQLEEARAEWKRLADAGTPYWCTHKGRSVEHPAAYWQDDDASRPIRRKHGVMCGDCGGYIQEG